MSYGPTTSASSQHQSFFGPIFGYAPTTPGFLPAENEAWLLVDKDSKEVALYEGRTEVLRFKAFGEVSLNEGKYFIQSKDVSPSWYASDEYFTSRDLMVPSLQDSLRWRKGVLGKQALLLPEGFAIHSARLWTKEVGGLRLEEQELSKLYDKLSPSSLVVVR